MIDPAPDMMIERPAETSLDVRGEAPGTGSGGSDTGGRRRLSGLLIAELCRAMGIPLARVNDRSLWAERSRRIREDLQIDRGGRDGR